MSSNTTSILLSLGILLLAGCATRPAPEIAGRWKAVNRYADATQEIPLSRAYMFAASPLDGTLKTMLERWAKDSGKTLTWLHSSDFTLSKPVADLHTSDLQDAVSHLNIIYAPQQLSITAVDDEITVRHMGVTSTAALGVASTDRP